MTNGGNKIFARRVLLITHAYPPITGGIANIIHSVAVSLGDALRQVIAPWDSRRKGYEDAAARKEEVKALDAANSFPVRRIWLDTSSRARSVMAFALFNLRCAAAIARMRPRLVYYGLGHPVALSSVVCRLLGIPYVIHAYGSELLRKRGPVGAALRRQALKHAARCIAISHWTKNALEETGAVPGRVAVIHPRIAPERLQPIHDPQDFRVHNGLDGKLTLLTVAHIIHRKGQHLVVEALPRLVQKYPDVLYIAAGVGPDLEKLKALARERGVEDYVVFPGNRDITDFFNTCDIFVMPSLYVTEPKADIESFGVVYLEANYFGKPVVGARNGGIPEAVADGVSGLLVETGSVDDLVEKLDTLLGDPELRERLGRQGRERVLADFTEESLRPELEREILSLLPARD